MPMTIAELDEKIQEIDRQIAYFCPPDYEMLYEAPFNKSVADKLRAVRDELKKLRDSTVCATSGKIRTDTDEYFSDDCLYSRSEIAGLKEYHVDDIIVGDRFYIPLPWYLGDDMNEQKFLRCIAKKDIPKSAVRFGPYVKCDLGKEPRLDVRERYDFAKNMPDPAKDEVVSRLISRLSAEIEELEFKQCGIKHWSNYMLPQETDGELREMELQRLREKRAAIKRVIREKKAAVDILREFLQKTGEK